MKFKASECPGGFMITEQLPNGCEERFVITSSQLIQAERLLNLAAAGYRIWFAADTMAGPIWCADHDDDIFYFDDADRDKVLDAAEKHMKKRTER